MPIKIWAAAASLVFAVLIAWAVYAGATVNPTVQPTVGAQTSAKGAGKVAVGAVEEALARRTRGQSEAVVADGTKSLSVSESGERIELVQGGAASGMPAQWREQVGGDPKTLLRPPAYLSGVATLPYREANVLVQPQGRNFRYERNEILRYAGGIAVLLVCLTLAVFLLWRGRIDATAPQSGQSVLRFDLLERSAHWLTASAFLIMALTGVVILYGKSLLLPWMGAYSFSWLVQASAWAHMAAALPFVIGICLMVIRWLPGNVPTRLDWVWLKRFGGFLHEGDEHPPAGRFNAGQKLVFWSVVIGGLGMLLTGLLLMLPFFVVGYDGMHWAQLVHSALGLALISLIIGHIYIGSVGMVGAFQAMWSGYVDLNWAKSHHRLWLERFRSSNTGKGDARDARPGHRSR